MNPALKIRLEAARAAKYPNSPNFVKACCKHDELNQPEDIEKMVEALNFAIENLDYLDAKHVNNLLDSLKTE